MPSVPAMRFLTAGGGGGARAKSTKKSEVGSANPPGVVVIFGDEDFLRVACRKRIEQSLFGEESDDLAITFVDGAQAQLVNVLDELRTPPFFSDRRLVVVETADKFITAHRDALLRYATAPSPVGVLLLEPASFPSNTKLYKEVERSGLLIEAKTPNARAAGEWCVAWSASHYGKTLDPQAADWLVELIDVHLGQLDQELGKLATFVGESKRIEPGDVEKLVAGTRTGTPFKILDQVLAGNSGKALKLLDRQIISGDSPVMLLAVMTSQLKRLAFAALRHADGASPREACSQAGILPFAVTNYEQALRRLGAPRARQLLDVLLKADLDMKGGSALPQRTVLERLIVRLCR